MFSYLLYRKVIENSENHVNQMKNVYQIDQNAQNEPNLTKVVGRQSAKMDQYEHSSPKSTKVANTQLAKIRQNEHN